MSVDMDYIDSGTTNNELSTSSDGEGAAHNRILVGTIEIQVPPHENTDDVESMGDDDDTASDDSTQPIEAQEMPTENEILVVQEPQPSPKKEKELERSADEDGHMCSICFESWTGSGEHRLISLRCGHLFGRSCILRWLKGQGSRCPQCNARARKSEIRPIYSRSVKVLDTAERDRALRDLQKESELRRQCELECAKLRLQYNMSLQECERLKKQLIETQFLLNESRSSGKGMEKLNQLSQRSSASFMLAKNIEMKGGGCRVMDGCDLLGMLAVSQPTINPLFPGFGLRKISISEMRLLEFIHLHQKPIKDLSFHSHDGLMLTASLDKTVKLSNFLSNSVVQQYNLDCDVWSCIWDRDDPCYFFAGTRTGMVYVFDIRVTDRHVFELSQGLDKSPVVSLEYLKRQPSAQRRACGPIVGQLGSCCFYEKCSPNIYEKHMLPLDGKLTSLSCESTTGHLLASLRPSVKHSKVTHVLCEMTFDGRVSCNLVQEMIGGATQVQLNRSKLLFHPDNDSLLICAGDEEAKAALMWNGSNGELLDSLKSDSPVLDVTTFRDNHKSILATLTEKNLRVYDWTRT